jgi:hypothetical protein
MSIKEPLRFMFRLLLFCCCLASVARAEAEPPPTLPGRALCCVSYGSLERSRQAVQGWFDLTLTNAGVLVRQTVEDVLFSPFPLIKGLDSKRPLHVLFFPSHDKTRLLRGMVIPVADAGAFEQYLKDVFRAQPTATGLEIQLPHGLDEPPLRLHVKFAGDTAFASDDPNLLAQVEGWHPSGQAQRLVDADADLSAYLPPGALHAWSLFAASKFARATPAASYLPLLAAAVSEQLGPLRLTVKVQGADLLVALDAHGSASATWPKTLAEAANSTPPDLFNKLPQASIVAGGVALEWALKHLENALALAEPFLKNTWIVSDKAKAQAALDALQDVRSANALRAKRWSSVGWALAADPDAPPLLWSVAQPAGELDPEQSWAADLLALLLDLDEAAAAVPAAFGGVNEPALRLTRSTPEDQPVAEWDLRLEGWRAGVCGIGPWVALTTARAGLAEHFETQLAALGDDQPRTLGALPDHAALIAKRLSGAPAVALARPEVAARAWLGLMNVDLETQGALLAGLAAEPVWLRGESIQAGLRVEIGVPASAGKLLTYLYFRGNHAGLDWLKPLRRAEPAPDPAP